MKKATVIGIGLIVPLGFILIYFFVLKDLIFVLKAKKTYPFMKKWKERKIKIYYNWALTVQSTSKDDPEKAKEEFYNGHLSAYRDEYWTKTWEDYWFKKRQELSLGENGLKV